MTAADRVLEALDAGLQRSSEWGLEVAEPGTCWRCTVRAVAEDSDLCAPCRAFLLEDLDVDPKVTLTVEELEVLAAFVREFVAVVKPLLEAFVEKILEVFRPMFERSSRLELPGRTVDPTRNLIPPGGARRFPTIPTRDLRATEAPRAAPTPRRIRP